MHNTGAASISWCGTTCSVDSLYVFNGPHVQLCASIPVRAFKIPNAGSHNIVWTHDHTANADSDTGVGSAALAAAAVSCMYCNSNIPHGIINDNKLN